VALFVRDWGVDLSKKLRLAGATLSIMLFVALPAKSEPQHWPASVCDDLLGFEKTFSKGFRDSLIKLGHDKTSARAELGAQRNVLLSLEKHYCAIDISKKREGDSKAAERVGKIRQQQSSNPVVAVPVPLPDPLGGDININIETPPTQREPTHCVTMRLDPDFATTNCD
jgi:hypothetical protein